MCGSSVASSVAGVMSLGATNGMPAAPGAPVLPQYPNLTPQEQANLAQQSQASQLGQGMVGGVSSQLGNNQNILQQISGLFNSDGSINQNAVAQLQQMAGSQIGSAGMAGQSSLSGIGSTNAALGATQQAYTQALQGNAPANQQLQYQQTQNFQAMQEQAAQQGIKITGTGFNDAVSDSTAGQKLIQNFQQNANIQNQNYQLGYLGQLGTNMGQLASTGATQATTGMGLSSYSQQTPLNYLGQSISGGQAALSPILSNYQTQLSNAYNPLYMQQIGPYQQAMAQQQANYQGEVGQYNAGMGQAGAISGIIMPQASFLGFGVNPNQGWSGAQKGMSSGGGGGFSMGGGGTATA